MSIDDVFLYEVTVAKELMQERTGFWDKKVAETLAKVEKYFQTILEKDGIDF